MKKKNIIVTIIIIILAIIIAMFYIFNLENNKHEIDNNYNNSTNFQINKSIDKNSSLNNNENHADGNQAISSNNNDIKKDSNSYYDEALEAKLGVEKYVLDKNEIAGYPIYKHHRLGSWLVPIFDKKTNKFVGSVYIYKGGQAFVLGPDSYSEYKKIVYGKTSHNSDSNKQDGTNKFDSNKYNKIQNDKDNSISNSRSNNSNSILMEQTNTNLDKTTNYGINQQKSIISLDIGLNSTC